MIDYNDGKWHGWNGGECPVHDLSVVEVFYDGEMDDGKAVMFAWDHCGSSDIAAFRVALEYKGKPKPREFWICGPEAFDSRDEAVYHCGNAADIIHVREVIE